MEKLFIDNNKITSNGLDDITRLLESTHIRNINLEGNGLVFDNITTTQRFAHGLSRNQYLVILNVYMVASTSSHAAAMIFQALESNNVLEEITLGQLSHQQQGIEQLIESLPRMKGLKRLYMKFIDWEFCLQLPSFLPALHQNSSIERIALDIYPWHRGTTTEVINILARNCSMRRAGALLTLQRPSGMPIHSKSGLWYKAFGIFADSDDHSDSGSYTGASAIFKILRARPAILEKQLRRPAAGTVALDRPGDTPQDRAAQGMDNGGTNNVSVGGRKRLRL